MKMFKAKQISSIVCAVLVFTMLFGGSVWARENVKSKDNTLTKISPYYVASCPQGGKHDMRQKGTARVYEGSKQKPGKQIFYGFTCQCSKCNLVLASEGSPWVSGILGRYRLDSFYEPISVNTSFYGGIHGTFKGDLYQDSFWSGFSFP